jgi:hypothetical protein
MRAEVSQRVVAIRLTKMLRFWNELFPGMSAIFKDRLGRQADFGDLQLLQRVQHLDHALVIHVVRAFDHDLGVRIRPP